MNKDIMMAAVAAMCMTTAGYAAEIPVHPPEGDAVRNHGVYIGVGFGPTELKTSGQAREISGIDFTYDTKANDLGGIVYLGGWITDHVGIEAGTRNYGIVDVPFAFHDPHDNTTGTGESQVKVTGGDVALMLGFDIGRNVQVVGRAAALMWKEDFDSRFDIPGKPAIKAKLNDSGTGPLLGAGLTYRFTPGWQLEARYEYAKLDQDDFSLLTVGLSYDFIGHFRD